MFGAAQLIYDGRPFLGIGIAGIVGVLSTGMFSLMGSRMFGPYFPVKALAIMLIPMLGCMIFGFSYKVKCLFLGVDGSSVAVLKSRDRLELVAQRAIEGAKRSYESKEKPTQL